MAAAWVGSLLIAGAARAVAADDPAAARAEKQRSLIALIESDKPDADKALACKQLAVCGTADAVPALAALLTDPELSSWARIPLEVIPGPAADYGLRQAINKLEGRLLIGVLYSVGNRRDAKAVELIAAKLRDADPEVASAAAVSLGRIGGGAAAAALTPLLATAPVPVRSAVAQGCMLCAERSLAAGDRAASMKLYDAVRAADVPVQRRAEAVRGAILARGSDGIPLLLEHLRSPDKTLFTMALRVARELPGREVTQALAAEVDRAQPERQARVLLALADRNDDAVIPAVMAAARKSATPVRVAAIGALEHHDSAAAVPLLLEAVTDADAAVARAAQTALTRLSGEEVDAALVARLPQATGKVRQTLIELAGTRRIEAALPALLPALTDSDPALRAAAVETVGVLGKDREAAELVRLIQKTTAPQERENLETALLAVSGRGGAACVPHLLPLTRHADGGLRVTGLHALAAVGGPEALGAVKAAVNDPEETVQDEAVRTLSTWPNNWPDDVAAAEPLLALVKSGRKKSHQILGFRGYLECVQVDKRLTEDAKALTISELLPQVQLPEEKQSAIAALGRIPSAHALKALTGLSADASVAEEAYSAMAGLAAKAIPGVSKEERQKALETVVQGAKSQATRKRAQEGLKGLR